MSNFISVLFCDFCWVYKPGFNKMFQHWLHNRQTKPQGFTRVFLFCPLLHTRPDVNVFLILFACHSSLQRTFANVYLWKIPWKKMDAYFLSHVFRNPWVSYFCQTEKEKFTSLSSHFIFIKWIWKVAMANFGLILKQSCHIFQIFWSHNAEVVSLCCFCFCFFGLVTFVVWKRAAQIFRRKFKMMQEMQQATSYDMMQ